MPRPTPAAAASSVTAPSGAAQPVTTSCGCDHLLWVLTKNCHKLLCEDVIFCDCLIVRIKVDKCDGTYLCRMFSSHSNHPSPHAQYNLPHLPLFPFQSTPLLPPSALPVLLTISALAAAAAARRIHELVDVVDDVCADQHEPAEVAAVHAANGDWRTVEVSVRQHLTTTTILIVHRQ